MATLHRPRTPPRGAPAAALPGDVRFTRGAATLLFVLVGAGLVGVALMWFARSPLFPIRAIQLEGELARNSVPTIRANAAPRLAGNFFSADLDAARAAFEAVPWVRQAVVRRVWPDRLAVRLEEHRAAALWEGTGGEEGAVADRLVNSFGEVFQANLGDVEDEALPTLAGPEGRAAEMLALQRALVPVLATLEQEIERIELSARGSWRVLLASGAALELGRGEAPELLARAERFTRTYNQVHARWHAPLEYADLRHADGYAVRLRGVSTSLQAPSAATGKPSGPAPTNN